VSAVTSNRCCCIICKKETSHLGIDTHFLRSHTSSDLWKNSYSKKDERIKTYNRNPKTCKHCSKKLRYSERNNKFCSHSCSAKFNNTNRNWRPSEQHKNAIKEKLSKEKIIVGPYTRVYFRSCKVCSLSFATAKKFLKCDTCRKQVNPNIPFRFTFNVYDYPDLFDLSLIEKHGWFSAGGKKKNVNLAGVSRDHKISCAEALRNKYNPYYISHPLNCELMLHSKNNRKNSKSSLNYQELVEQVNNYDVLRGGH